MGTEKQRKREALELVFKDVEQVHGSEKSIKEALIDFLDDAISTINFVASDEHSISTIRESIMRLCDIRDMVKRC